MEGRAGASGEGTAWRIPVLVGTVVASAAVVGGMVVLAGSGGYAHRWGMMDGSWGGPGNGGGILFAMVLAVPIVAAVLLVVLLVSLNARRSYESSFPRSPCPPTAGEVASLRYARGEITAEQYQKILRDLRETSRKSSVAPLCASLPPPEL